MLLLKLYLLVSLYTKTLAISIIPEGYQKNIKPTTPEEGPVKIGVSLKINGIQQVNIEKMSVVFDMNLRLTWTDDRLRFPHENSSDAKLDLESMTISTEILKRIWVPDHFFRRIRSIRQFALLTEAAGVMMFKNLTIYTSSVVQIEVGCPMSFVNFPFDEQKCELYIGSYFHTMKEMSFHWLPLGLSVDEEVFLQLASYDVQVKAAPNTKCICAKCIPNESACIKVLLFLERRYMVHLLSYYIPSTLFLGVSWASFFWPADVIPGRTVLVITALLTASSLYAASRSDSPTTSYVKAIDAWMFLIIVLATIALFQYAVVLQWKRKQNECNVSNAVTPVSMLGDKKRTLNTANRAERFILYQKRTELLGQIGLPIVFLLFNIVYWPYYV